MVEFDPREKVIILATTYLSSPAQSHVPVDVLVSGIQLMLKARKINVTTFYVHDIINAIKREQNESIRQGFDYLNQNKDKLGLGGI
jgi:hypothetical protein